MTMGRVYYRSWPRARWRDAAGCANAQSPQSARCITKPKSSKPGTLVYKYTVVFKVFAKGMIDPLRKSSCWYRTLACPEQAEKIKVKYPDNCNSVPWSHLNNL